MQHSGQGPPVASTSVDVEFEPGAPELTEEAPPPKRKRRRFTRPAPRQNRTIDRIVRLLEDKRIQDSSQLQDLKMPRLRRVLNIIFVALGVCFLLAVVVVIVYTEFEK